MLCAVIFFFICLCLQLFNIPTLNSFIKQFFRVITRITIRTSDKDVCINRSVNVCLYLLINDNVSEVH